MFQAHGFQLNKRRKDSVVTFFSKCDPIFRLALIK